MTAKKIRKLRRAKKVVTEVVTDKAVALNPLTPPEPQGPVINPNVPQITNESIAEHREDVLSGARKYIYPLAHSKHRILVMTSGILIATLAAFLVYCLLGYYKVYQYNAFLYRVSQVVPFPIAKADGHYIDYENYLYELRHYVHYYESQLQRDFSGVDKQQLIQQRKQALDKVINQAYIKDLAKQNGVSVSNKEVDARIQIVRDQNRLGSNDKVFADVLRDYLGWSPADFRRSLKQQILAEKVAAKLDTQATRLATDVAAKVARKNVDFGESAKKYSIDSRSKANGGDYGFVITKSNPNVPPQVVNALFAMKAGSISGPILASPVSGSAPTYEIVKVIKNDGKTVTAQHISIPIKDVSTYIEALKQQNPPKTYVHF